MTASAGRPPRPDNDADTGFGVENLPYGVARLPGGSTGCVSALGDDVIDLATLARAGTLGVPADILEDCALNRFLACGRATWEGTRRRLRELIEGGDRRLTAALIPMAETTMLLPVTVGDYVDFYTSEAHATNMGQLLRGAASPADALPPHWRHQPLGYHGRSGTLVVSGTPVTRPRGQVAPGCVVPTDRLDVEVELGMVVGAANSGGEPVPTSAVRDHVAGVVLVNDWSARDVQAFEAQPLGPFLGKSFATSVSPWLVTLDALEPYRVPAPVQDPPPVEYLATVGDWAYDLHFELLLQSEAMRGAGLPAVVLSRPTAAGLYWTMPQLLAHATVNGTAVRPGDLFASGTISGTEPGTQGSLMELTWGGDRPIELPDGTSRRFLEDGDIITIRGWAGRPGHAGPPPLSLGEVTGTVLPARPVVPDRPADPARPARFLEV